MMASRGLRSFASVYGHKKDSHKTKKEIHSFIITMATTETRQQRHVLTLPPAQDDSSVEETTASPSKRPRLDNDVTDARPGHDWDNYVKQGARLKSLIDAAIHRSISVDKATPVEEEGRSPRLERFSTEQESNVAKLACEKTAECIVLQRVSTQYGFSSVLARKI